MDANHSTIVRFLMVTAAFIVVVAGMRAAEAILVPFLLSLFIAVLVSPLLLWLQRKGVPSLLAILLIVLGLLVLSSLLVLVVGSSVSSFSDNLPQYRARLNDMGVELAQRLEVFGLETEAEVWREIINPGSALALAGTTLESFSKLMTNAFLILLTVVFILAEAARFGDKLISANPRAAGTLAAMARFSHSVNRYMALKALLSLATGVLISLWLWLIGVDYALLWGVLAFLLNFIPNLGSILAGIPAVLLALVQLGVGDAMLVVVGYLVVNTVIGNILEPRIMGQGLDLSALVVFLSLVFWGWVLGPVGMLLSVPLTVTVKIALESFPETRWLGVMLSSGRTSTPEATPVATQE